MSATRGAGPAPTLRDVAEVAGVSFKTVSNVLNDHPQVRASTRERVMAAVEQLGYRPNLAARNLRRGRSGVIGLAVPELGQAFFAQLADVVIRTAKEQGLVVLVEQTGGDRERELEVLRSPRLSLTDGLLLAPLGLTAQDAGDLEPGVPLVVLGEPLFGAGVDHVTMRHEDAARAATQHLLSLGRRRVLLLGAHAGEVGSVAALRHAGYASALAGAGAPLDPALVVPVETWDRPSGARAMAQALDAGVRMDAVFAMNDDLALGALRTLQERGRSVPRDVALVGFDDVADGRFAYPSLTTVQPGIREVARLAVGFLQERVEHAASMPSVGRVVAPDFRLVVRESTGA
ncbi:MAG: LacI family DNA-binding transcriptional regulator [Cellulomonas iranensis]|uniref:LacI family DNA-binding transcriptional regulator n=1 Tax=Cellulomonas iranensis TaxID=76862 RepID=UPI001B01A5C2|nr:LacI family DNA-binding transcriptional regulator [Cellulomonas iranensis]MBO9569602.1 LacI family DNA-binding transcriptional regulator [Cellulomonas iranensis]